MPQRHVAAAPPGSPKVVRVAQLGRQHIDFLKLLCTELTYRDIARVMEKSPRTIDGYRDQLFERLGCHSRTGLVLWAVKHHLIKLRDLK